MSYLLSRCPDAVGNTVPTGSPVTARENLLPSSLGPRPLIQLTALPIPMTAFRGESFAPVRIRMMTQSADIDDPTALTGDLPVEIDGQPPRCCPRGSLARVVRVRGWSWNMCGRCGWAVGREWEVDCVCLTVGG